MTNTDKVTNLDYLTELSKGDAGFVTDMISIFLAENPEELNELGQPILVQNFEQIRYVSHQMKSTIPFVGLDRIIGRDLSDIEKWAAEKTGIEAIGTLFTKVKTVCEKAHQELNS